MQLFRSQARTGEVVQLLRLKTTNYVSKWGIIISVLGWHFYQRLSAYSSKKLWRLQIICVIVSIMYSRFERPIDLLPITTTCRGGLIYSSELLKTSANADWLKHTRQSLGNFNRRLEIARLDHRYNKTTAPQLQRFLFSPTPISRDLLLALRYIG